MGFEIRNLISMFENIYEMFYNAEKNILGEIINMLFFPKSVYVSSIYNKIKPIQVK